MKIVSYILPFFLISVFSFGQNTHCWQPLGKGVRGTTPYSLVDHMQVDTSGNFIYVLGSFDTAGSHITRGIATWDGIQWGKVNNGYGVTFSSGPIGCQCVFKSLFYRDTFYIAGEFSNLDYKPALKVAYLTNKTWTAISTNQQTSPRAFTVFNDELYIGGSSSISVPSNFMKWNGTQWIDVTNDTAEYDNSFLEVFNNELFGSCRTNVPGLGKTPVVRKLNGSSWEVIGIADSWIISGAVYKGELYVCGTFTEINGQPFNHIAKFNGQKWSSLGNGVDINNFTQVNTFHVYQDTLFVGGSFDSVEGKISHSIAKWDGSSWHPIKYGLPNSSVHDMIHFQDELYVSGYIEPVGMITELQTIARLCPVTKCDTNLSVVNYDSNRMNVTVFPNPFVHSTTFKINTDNTDGFYFLLTDPLGRIVHGENISSNEFIFDRNGLSSGLYFYSIICGPNEVARGKLAVE